MSHCIALLSVSCCEDRMCSVEFELRLLEEDFRETLWRIRPGDIRAFCEAVASRGGIGSRTWYASLVENESWSSGNSFMLAISQKYQVLEPSMEGI
jgi:hypothetical protein